MKKIKVDMSNKITPINFGIDTRTNIFNCCTLESGHASFVSLKNKRIRSINFNICP